MTQLTAPDHQAQNNLDIFPAREAHTNELRAGLRPSQETIEEGYRNILAFAGEDPDREGLLRTPHRAAEAFKYLTSGYSQDVETLLNGAVFREDYDDMVVVKDIEFYSLCEHHLLPFVGQAHVAYLPDKRILGLSKLARIVERYSRALQVQERMTQQVATWLQDELVPRGVGVVLEAEHMCMSVRGVRTPGAKTVTSALRGRLRDDARTRGEFLDLVRRR